MFLRSVFPAVAIVALVFSAVLAEDNMHSEMHDMPMGAPDEMKEIAFFEGEWDVDMQWQDMQDPGKWNSSKASCAYKFVLDGCAMEMTFKGDMMGMPFDGYMLISYDRDKDEWQSLWIDNIGGKMSFYTGNRENDKMILVGEEMWQGEQYLSRWVSFNHTPTSFDWTMDNSYDGGNTWQTMGKATYTRK